MKRHFVIPFTLALAACASAPGPSATAEHPKATPADLKEIEAVMKRDFHSRGQATMDRIALDDVQRLCNLNADQPPADAARAIEEAQLKAIRFPSGSLIGDWKKGERLAQSGRGAMWSDKPGVQEGASCYNCHQISPKETAFGTVGPSLAGFGRTRGNGAEMQRYVYGKIYNAKAYNACSTMPRLGASGSLNEEQIKDLVGLLLDPASPVNQ